MDRLWGRWLNIQTLVIKPRLMTPFVTSATFVRSDGTGRVCARLVADRVTRAHGLQPNRKQEGAKFHTSTTPLCLPTAIIFPSIEKAAAVTSPSIPTAVVTSARTCPEYTSEISIPSSVRHARNRQSGDTASGHPSLFRTLFISQLDTRPASCSHTYTALAHTDTTTLPSGDTPNARAPVPVPVTTPSTSIRRSVLPVLASDILTVPSLDSVTRSAPFGMKRTCVGAAWFITPATFFVGGIPGGLVAASNTTTTLNGSAAANFFPSGLNAAGCPTPFNAHRTPRPSSPARSFTRHSRFHPASFSTTAVSFPSGLKTTTGASLLMSDGTRRAPTAPGFWGKSQILVLEGSAVPELSCDVAT
ncbi:hypothetical protein CPAR01_16331 [Colletotrichum paranaense]|uniref:Uncharacterized protein n=1 Tax=Colletotrichum paranaense TaxID=1914294 RepID=A0ABQ9RWJ6_9PEZI|nr:uncharacterized protein CPAR01_16331 [Colletotrichum paranaense]KAK1516715.1 hypothetical protein CPAR01_16331 [Colletotrichum paranaense]